MVPAEPRQRCRDIQWCPYNVPSLPTEPIHHVFLAVPRTKCQPHQYHAIEIQQLRWSSHQLPTELIASGCLNIRLPIPSKQLDRPVNVNRNVVRTP